MRIAYLAAGAAGMYCGSCLHDNTLANALIARGHDVFLVPTYTPLRTDEPNQAVPRIFFGGVNSYLKQVSPWFRRAPRLLEWLVDSPRFLRLATSGAGSVDPAKLGALTVSMLRGEEGHQARQLDQLVDWLVDEAKPEVVHLSNSMLLGMARRIAERCGPPVVCSLSGEDIFLEQLVPPHYEEARALLRERAAEVAGFTALNGYYADFMSEYLSVGREKVHVVPHGLLLDGIPDRREPDAPRVDAPAMRIGYFARICKEKGLHLLVEACEALAERRPELAFELHAAGYLGAGDRDYLIDLRKWAERGPLKGRFRYHGELDRAAKYAFLGSLDLFSTPTVYAEAKGPARPRGDGLWSTGCAAGARLVPGDDRGHRRGGAPHTPRPGGPQPGPRTAAGRRRGPSSTQRGRRRGRPRAIPRGSDGRGNAGGLPRPNWGLTCAGDPA